MLTLHSKSNVDMSTGLTLGLEPNAGIFDGGSRVGVGFDGVWFLSGGCLDIRGGAITPCLTRGVRDYRPLHDLASNVPKERKM